MTVSLKHLASGQLSSTKSTLYTSPADTTTKISRVILTNTSSSSVLVTFWRNDGNEMLLTSFTVPGGSGKTSDVFELQGANLAETQLIAARAATASVLNYQIDGDTVT